MLDAIERWSPSEIPTFSVDVTCTADSDASALVDLFESNHFAAEDWSTSVRHLCAECSRGNPGTHDHPFPEGETRRSFGLASPLGLADRLLAEWRDAAPHRRAYENLAPADAGS